MNHLHQSTDHQSTTCFHYNIVFQYDDAAVAVGCGDCRRRRLGPRWRPLGLAAAGFEVVCLEQGDWTGPADYMSDRPEAELAWVERWNPDPNVRRAPADYPLTGEADVRPVMYNGVGGGLVQWAAMWQPLLASDFRVRTLDGVADDWPIGWSDLVVPYGRVAREMSVSGLGGDPALPELEPYPNPPIPIGRIGLAAARGMDRLGWHWWPGANAIASRRHRSLQACQRRGTCMLGCPENAKATPSLTHWPAALAAGARLVTGARVAQIPLDERGRARGVGVLWTVTGWSGSQPAQVVILAANAVGTARLLLLSASPRFSGRSGQLLGTGRAQAHAAPLPDGHGRLRGAPRQLAGSLGGRASTPWSLPRPILTATSCEARSGWSCPTAVPCSRWPNTRRRTATRASRPFGVRPSTGRPPRFSDTPSLGASRRRICPRTTIG